MELKIDGKTLQLKYNFASLKLWEEKVTDDDGKKQQDDAIFDTLFTGLATKNPRVLVDIINGGLAYLGNAKPDYGKVFDAVSDLLGEKGLDKVAEQTMAELTAFGFFKVSMKQWMSSIKEELDNLDKLYKELKKPAKAAKKEAKEQYDQQVALYQASKNQFDPMLKNFEKMLKDTGITL